MYKQVHHDYRVDIVGVNVGMGRIIDMCRGFGLSVLQPLGFDDSIKAVYHLKPLCVVARWPPEGAEDDFNNTCRTTARACQHQDEAGRLFLCEGAPSSTAWLFEEVRALTGNKKVMVTESNAAAYGAETEDGQPQSCRHRWATNSATISSNLDRQLTDEQEMYCVPVGQAREAAKPVTKVLLLPSWRA